MKNRDRLFIMLSGDNITEMKMKTLQLNVKIIKKKKRVKLQGRQSIDKFNCISINQQQQVDLQLEDLQQYQKLPRDESNKNIEIFREKFIGY